LRESPDDTYVPIFFADHGVSAQSIARRVATTDVAPTIATYLGIKQPSGSIGQPLEEVFEQDRDWSSSADRVRLS